MADADDTENSGDSDATEGETNEEEGDGSDEIMDDSETPVIDPSEGDQDAEEPVSDETENGDEITDATTMAGDDPEVTEFSVTDGTEDKSGYELNLGTATATADADYTFKVTAKENYEVSGVNYTVGTDSSVKTATKGEADDANAVTYTIEKTNITGDITLKVVAAKKTYTITVNKTDADSVLEFSTTPEADDGIKAGETLTFTAKVKDANKDDYKISELSCTMGSEDVTPASSADGVYTIANVSGNIVINVKAEKIPNHTVTFTKDQKVAEVTDIMINGEAAEKATLGASDSAWTIEAKEGSSVSFKLKPAEFYKVTAVKYNVTVDGETVEQTLNPSEAGVYTINALAADMNLTMDAELDETQSYVFTFAVSGDPKSATAAISMPEGATDEDGISGTTKNNGDKVVSRNQKVILTFTAAAGYQINDTLITATGATITKVEEAAGQEMVATSAKYELAMTKGTPATVTVGTDAIGIENANTVAIKLDGVKNLTLGDVKVDNTAVTPAEGKYAVAVGAKRVSFEIRAAGPYAPVVVNKANTTIEANVKQEGDNATYTYTVLASTLAEGGEEFTVTEKAVTRTLTFDGDTTNVNKVVSINGKALTEADLAAIPQGQTVTVKLTQKNNCALNAVSYKVGETAGPAVKVTKGAAEFNVKVTGDVVITVTAKGLYKAADLKDGKDQPVVPVKNVYNVSYDASYTAGVVQGAGNESVAIADAELLNGRASVAGVDGKEAVTISGTTVTVNLANATAVAGKKLTLNLYVTEGEGDAAEKVLGASYTLQVSKEISTITAPATAKQPTDTVKAYKVTTNGELSRLTVKVENSSVEGVIDGTPAFDSETNMLMIQTGQTAGTADVVISAGEVSKTIKVTSTALISKNTAKPTVKLKAASDIDLTLTLGAKKIETPEKGAVLYEVKVKPATGEDRPENLSDKVATQYILKKGDAQDVTVNVAKDGIPYGKGGAWKYDVEVALVHVKDQSVAITEANINDNLIADARSQAFTTGNKPFATQVPAWEVNLKLKKGTTTVYTGQSDAMIATPQFTKTTTYTEIADGDIADITFKDDEALSGLKIVNGQIYASATEKTAVGKHTVQVTAKAADSMYASRATIAVTVVRGIDKLGVDVPSKTVFKAAKKAATLKPVPVYNDGKTGKTETPKTKKVTWDVVKNAQGDAFEAGDPLYGMVSINKKNGTVTVNKDYVLSAESTDNQFVIKATVDNGANGSKFIGKASAAYSKPITITNVGADLNKVAVLKAVYEDDTQTTPPTEGGVDTPDTTAMTLKGYQVVAVADGRNNVDVEASAISGGIVKAFTADATDLAKEKVYTGEELAKVTVPNTDVSYKSSSAKNVAVNAADGTITVNKPAKAKLTVTANDGSKAKAEIALNVIFDKTENRELALKVSKAVPAADGSWTADGTVLYDPANPTDEKIRYNGSAVSRLIAEVMVKKADGSGYEAAPAYANYDIKITSGKKTQQQGNLAQLTSDKQEFKITLTDKSQTPAKPVDYFFVNADVLAGSSAKITAKALGTLHPVGTQADQKVTIELNKITEAVNTDATADGGKLAAAVEVDWNKLNDKNRADLNAFATDLVSADFEVKNYDKDAKKGTIELAFNSNNPAFKQSSYALKVTVGQLKDGKFTAKTVPAAVTVKVDKVKKFTYKPTTSYTIGLKDAGAVLTGKSSIPADDVNVTFTKLLNANIKGIENKFAQNFDIDKTKGMIVLKSDVADPLKIEKNDLTGYLMYSATTDKDYYDNKGATDQIVKITVKIKDAASSVKYGVSNELTIENRVGAATQPFTITAGSKNVEIAKNFMVQTKNVWISPSVNEDGKIILTLGKELAKNTKSFPATIYFAPKGSKWETTFENGPGEVTDEQSEAWWKENLKYAASVKVTVKVTAAVTTPPEEMDIATAKTKVTAWAAAINDAATKPQWLTSATTATATAVETALLADLKAAVNATDAIEFSINEESSSKQLTIVETSAETAGSVAATIKITKGEESDTVEVTLTIPKLTPEQPEQKEISETLKTAISDAVKAAATGDNKTITIKAGTQWDAISGVVLAAANGASGVSPDFEVVAADSGQLTTDSSNNEATIKVVVRQKNLTSHSEVITISGIALTTDETEPVE